MIPKLTKDDNREEKDKKKKGDINHQSLSKACSNTSIASTGSKVQITDANSNSMQKQNSLLKRIQSQIFEPEKQQDNKQQDSKWKVIKNSLSKLNSSDIDTPKNSKMSLGKIKNFGATQFDEEEDETDYLKRVYDDMNLVKTFLAGEAFGEIALMTKQRRTGTMVCKEDTHLMTLTKNGFDKILGQYHEQIKIQRLGFLKSYSFFNNIPNSNLLSILLDIKIEVYPKKTILFNQGDEVNNIFLVKRGEIQISRIIYENLAEENQNELSTNEKKKLYNNENILNKYNHSNKQKNVKQSQRQILISNQGSNSHIGCEDLSEHILNNLQSNNLSKYTFYHSNIVEVISQEAEVYKLNKHIFLNNLYMFKSIEEFAKQIKEKNQYYDQRLQKVIKAKGSSEVSMKNLIKQIDNKKIELEVEQLNTSRNGLNLSYMTNNSYDLQLSPTSSKSGQFSNYYQRDFPLEDNISERSISRSQRYSSDEQSFSIKNNNNFPLNKEYSQPNQIQKQNSFQKNTNTFDTIDFSSFITHQNQRPNSQFSSNRGSLQQNQLSDPSEIIRFRINSVQNLKSIHGNDSVRSSYYNRESIFLPEIENKDGGNSKRSSFLDTTPQRQSYNDRILNQLSNFKIQNNTVNTSKSRTSSQFNLQNQFYQMNNTPCRQEQSGKISHRFNQNFQNSSFSKYVLNLQKLQTQNNQLENSNILNSNRSRQNSFNQIQLSPRDNLNNSQYMSSLSQFNIQDEYKKHSLQSNSNDNNQEIKKQTEDVHSTLRKSDAIPADIQFALNQENPLLKSQKVLQLMKKQNLELKIKRKFLQNAINNQQIKASSSMFPTKQIENIKDLNINLFGEQSKYNHIILMQQLSQLEIRNPLVTPQNNEQQFEDQKYLLSEKEQSFLNYKKSSQIPASFERAQTNLIKYFHEKQKDKMKPQEENNSFIKQYSLLPSPMRPKIKQKEKIQNEGDHQNLQENDQKMKSRDNSPKLPFIFQSQSTPALQSQYFGYHRHDASKVILQQNKLREKKEQSQECKNIHTSLARQNKKHLKGLVKMLPQLNSAPSKKVKNIRNKLQSTQLTDLNTTSINKSQHIK